MAVGTCSLTVLAVGGGGNGRSRHGGLGSGYVDWEKISVEGSLMLEVKVGGPGRKTEVEIPYNWGGIGGDGGTKFVVAPSCFSFILAFCSQFLKFVLINRPTRRNVSSPMQDFHNV